jgi:hypothetical protein
VFALKDIKAKDVNKTYVVAEMVEHVFPLSQNKVMTHAYVHHISWVRTVSVLWPNLARKSIVAMAENVLRVRTISYHADVPQHGLDLFVKLKTQDGMFATHIV